MFCNGAVSSDKPVNEFITNGSFLCKAGDDIENYNIVDFTQEYDNILVLHIVDFYSYQKNQSLIGILEKIKSDSKFITISLDNLNQTGTLIGNITYQDCKLCGYKYSKSYLPNQVDENTIVEVKFRYQRSNYSNYIEPPTE